VVAVITVETAPHEFSANYLFAQDGLRPFFACDRARKDGGGSAKGSFEIDGETWNATLYTQDSGIVNPGETTPFGTPFKIEEIQEMRLSVERAEDEDSVGQQSFNAHLAPRWQGMEVEKNNGQRKELNVPEGIKEAVNVSVKGSNIEFDRYEELLRRAFQSVGVSRTYFESAHEYSNIQDAERYVRLDKDRSGPIHARDGPIASMAHLLENDREGYRKLVQNDNDEHGNNLPGYYHTVTLGPQRIAEAFPSQDLPKEIKHYYAREAASKPDSHPLAHPKLGASLQSSKWDGKLGVTDEAIAQLNDELRETVLSVLADAGLQVHPGENDPFFPGAYFDGLEVEHEDDPIVSLDLTQIQQRQESVVIKHLKGGLSPVEWESLDTLVTDGGEIAPQEIADEHDRHPDSVRRALRRIDELVEREYDRVSLRSNHVADLVHDAVQQAEDAVERAADAGAKALEAAERGLDEGTSALVAWASRHGVDLHEKSEGYVDLDLGTVEGEDASDVQRKIRRRLREGRRLWEEAGRDPRFFKGGSWHAIGVFDKYPHENKLSKEVRKNMNGFNGTG